MGVRRSPTEEPRGRESAASALALRSRRHGDHRVRRRHLPGVARGRSPDRAGATLLAIAGRVGSLSYTLHRADHVPRRPVPPVARPAQDVRAHRAGRPPQSTCSWCWPSPRSPCPVVAKLAALAVAGTVRWALHRRVLFTIVRADRVPRPDREPPPGAVRLSVVVPAYCEEGRIGVDDRPGAGRRVDRRRRDRRGRRRLGRQHRRAPRGRRRRPGGRAAAQPGQGRGGAGRRARRHRAGRSRSPTPTSPTRPTSSLGLLGRGRGGLGRRRRQPPPHRDHDAGAGPAPARGRRAGHQLAHPRRRCSATTATPSAGSRRSGPTSPATLFERARVDGFAFDVELFSSPSATASRSPRCRCRSRTRDRSTVRVVRDAVAAGARPVPHPALGPPRARYQVEPAERRTADVGSAPPWATSTRSSRPTTSGAPCPTSSTAELPRASAPRSPASPPRRRRDPDPRGPRHAPVGRRARRRVRRGRAVARASTWSTSGWPRPTSSTSPPARSTRPARCSPPSHNPAQYNGIKLCLAGAKPVGRGHRPRRDQGDGRGGRRPRRPASRGRPSSIDLLDDVRRPRAVVRRRRRAAAAARSSPTPPTAWAASSCPAVFDGLPFDARDPLRRARRHLPEPPGRPDPAREPGRPPGPGARDRRRRRPGLRRRRRPGVPRRREGAAAVRARPPRRWSPRRSSAKHPGATILHNLICSKAVPEVIRERGGTPVRTPGRPLVHQGGDGRDRRRLRRRALGATTTSATTTAPTPGSSPRCVVLEQLSTAGRAAVRAAQAVRALRRVGRDQHRGRRPAGGDRAGRRAPTPTPSRTASTGSPSTSATGGSTCGRRTPSRCCGSTSKRRRPPRSTPTSPRSQTLIEGVD